MAAPSQPVLLKPFSAMSSSRSVSAFPWLLVAAVRSSPRVKVAENTEINSCLSRQTRVFCAGRADWSGLRFGVSIARSRAMSASGRHRECRSGSSRVDYEPRQAEDTASTSTFWRADAAEADCGWCRPSTRRSRRRKSSAPWAFAPSLLQSRPRDPSTPIPKRTANRASSHPRRRSLPGPRVSGRKISRAPLVFSGEPALRHV